MALIKPAFRQLTAHFSTTELVCRHCGRAPSLEALMRLAEFGESLREGLGNEPIHVTSGYRCPAHNAAVGGAPQSYHMKCMALDFVRRGMTPYATWKRCKELQAEGLVGGLGRYLTWTHADFGPKRNWQGP